MELVRTKPVVVAVMVVALVNASWMPSAQAAMIATGEALAIEAAADDRATVERFFSRGDVAAELERYGVDVTEALARAERLTATELAELADRIDTAEAGGDAIGVIGVVFLVLMILELVGVTDIFKAF